MITNVARGDIVDDEALIDALNRRKIYAAGLDVYKGEPFIIFCLPSYKYSSCMPSSPGTTSCKPG